MSVMDNGSDNGTGRPAVLLRRVTLASVAVALVLIVLKLGAYVLTESVAMLSSLVDSMLDALASLINLFAVRQALVPADREHRFGHGKAEPLAGLAQAAFISGSALFLVFEAISRLVNPVDVSHGAIGVGVMVVSLVMTVGLVAYQRFVIRQTGSLAIRADALHYASDIVLNLTVMVAIILSVWFRLPVADPVFALAVAAWICYAAWQIGMHSLDQLMDRELPDQERERIKAICLGHPEVRAMHELRTRKSGMDMFIQLHLELDGDMGLTQAHAIAEEVDREIRVVYPTADVIIHQDPV